jgi:LMBR1 domain-containing protein 1
MLGFYVTGFMGIVGIGISLAWLAHIAVYLLPPYPLHPMLNDLFVVLDGAFALLGVAAFGGFCLYLMGGCSAKSF